MTIREFLTENSHLDREELIDSCTKELGVTRKSVITTISKSKDRDQSEDDRTLEFRKQFDKSFIIPQKVKQVIETWLQEVKWASDADMQKRCQIGGAADWKTYARENGDFDKYILYAGKKAVWAYSEEYRDELQRRVYSR